VFHVARSAAEIVAISKPLSIDLPRSMLSARAALSW
jgi:hypothetical protein